MCHQGDCSIYPETTSEIDEGGKTPLKQKDSIQFGQPGGAFSKGWRRRNHNAYHFVLLTTLILTDFTRSKVKAGLLVGPL